MGMKKQYKKMMKEMLRQQSSLLGAQGTLTSPLSGYTQRGLDTLTRTPTNPIVEDVLTRTAQGGQFSNPYAGQTDLSGVTEAITRAAQRGVGDRFSMAGRSGSPAEGLTLGSTIARELAPFAFGANESALNRGFQGYEAERARQLGALSPLEGLHRGRASDLITAGSIVEQNRNQRNMDPWTRLMMMNQMTGGGGAPAGGGSKLSGALGGAMTGAKLGGKLGGPWGAAGGAVLGGIGGLL